MVDDAELDLPEAGRAEHLSADQLRRAEALDEVSKLSLRAEADAGRHPQAGAERGGG